MLQFLFYAKILNGVIVCEKMKLKYTIIFFKFSNINNFCTVPYRKVPKFSDARKLCCNLPKIQGKKSKPFCISSKRSKWNSKQ